MGPNNTRRVLRRDARSVSRVSHCKDLTLCCPVLGRCVPQVLAVITLANGQRFQGSWTKSPDEAAESAAANALLTLVSRGPGRRPRGPSGLESGGGETCLETRGATGMAWWRTRPDDHPTPPPKEFVVVRRTSQRVFHSKVVLREVYFEIRKKETAGVVWVCAD